MNMTKAPDKGSFAGTIQERPIYLEIKEDLPPSGQNDPTQAYSFGVREDFGVQHRKSQTCTNELTILGLGFSVLQRRVYVVLSILPPYAETI